MSPLSELRVLQARVVDRFALSSVQGGMLVHALNRPDEPGLDIQQVSITVHHALDAALYVYAWYTVMERHAVLRSRLRWEGLDRPVQEVLDAVELPVARADWRGLAPDELRQQLHAVAHQERLQGFDLSQAPLMRLHLARIGDLSWNILWTFHHVLLDGRAFDTVLRETFEVHDSLRQRREVLLPPVGAYRNDLEAEDTVDEGPTVRFWQQQLAGWSSPTPLGIDLPPTAAAQVPPEQRFGARQCWLEFDVSRALRARVAEAGVTLNTLLMAAWALLLHRYGGSSDVVFGTTRSLRHRLPPAQRQAAALLINTVPVRLAVDLAQPIDEWLPQIRQQQRAMRPHEHAPLARIHQAMGLAPGQRLFDTLVVYDHQSLTQRMQALGGPWESRHVDHVGQTGFDLTLVAYGDPQVLLRLEYDRRRFSDGVIERMLGHLGCLLEALASDRYERLGDLPWITPGELKALIGEPLQALPRGPLLHERFEAHARRTPHAPALTVIDDDGRRHEWSYRELDRRANALARRLRDAGAQPNRCVGLRCERNAELALGLLAILKAGAAYLPLDPVYPRERAAYMIEDAGVRLLVCSPSLALEWQGADLVSLVADSGAEPSDADAAPLPAVGSPDDLAYVIYTSGSTGSPKGVPISHHNVGRLFDGTHRLFGFDDRDVWTLFHSYSFDFSVWEIWGAWIYGGRLLCVSQAQSRDPAAFGELLVRERVTVLNQTPTAFRRLIDEACGGPAWPLSLRYVVFGGEALELQMLRPWFDRYGDERPRLVNMYGITETTVHVTYRPITRGDLDEAVGSVIGEPLPDLKLILINERGELVPRGVPGEMAVAGAGLSRGYLNRPELTEQRFVPDPFSDDPQARLYLSGDLARWLDNGDLEYLGRRDQQVKIRGFRIELGEIESQLARHPHVRQVAVIAREDRPGDRRLVAYVVPALLGRGVHEGASEPDLASELRAHVRGVLPDYMVPAHFVCLDELPLTGNGKLDRAALPPPTERPVVTPDTTAAAEDAAPGDPLTAQLARIWSDVLRVPSVGADQHFMELGGDSILSIQVIARCRQAGLKLSLRDLFEHPTVALLAARVRELGSPDVAVPAALPTAAVATQVPAAPLAPPSVAVGAAVGVPAVAAPSVAPVPTLTTAAHAVARPDEATPVPLTPIQHWFFDQRFADPEHWNQAFAFRLLEPVTAAQLETAWTWLVSQHPALRQCFQRDAHGQWYPSVAAGAVAPVVSLSVAALSDDAARAVVEERATEAQAGLSFERGPLARLLLVDAGPRRPAWLVLVVHHLVVDGVSWRVLREDLEAALLAIRRNGLPPERPASADMSAWACALQDEAREAAVLAEWPHWQRVASCAPWQVPRGRGPSGPVVLTRRLSPQATSTLLRQLPVRGRVSVPGALLATLAAALHTSTGRRDWRLDLEGHGREPLQGPGAMLEVSRTVGWFTTLFPHTLVLSDDPTPLAAAQATQTALDAVPRKGLGYGLLRWLAADPEVRHALARQPASPLLFNYLGQWDAVLAGSELMRFAEASTGPWRSPQAHRSHALELLVMVREGVLSVEASHDARQVDADWVASLLDAWVRELQLLVRQLDAPEAVVEPAEAVREAAPDRVGAAAAPPTAPLPQTVARIAEAPPPPAAARLPVPSQPGPLPVDTAVQGPTPASEAPPARSASWRTDALARPASTTAHVADGGALLPVTPLQQLFMAVHGASDDPGLQQWQFVLDGDLSPLRMRQALQQVVRRHGILRTAFLTDPMGEPGQQVLDSATVPWRDEDWSAIAVAEQERRLAIGLAADRATPMRLDQPPLMRVWLIARGARRWHLVWTTHHLILDGWSWPLLMAEWSRACTSLAQARLPDEGPPLQFADYVQWLVQDWPRHGEPESRAYWARQLRGVTAPTPVGQPPLPADAGADAAAVPVHSAERVQRLSPGSGSALVQKARQWRVTPGTLMLAAWAAVLAHRADELDIVLGCTLSGRPAELDGIESLVGPCVNNVPLVLTLQPSQTLQAWLGQLQLAQQDAVQHQYLGLEAIQQLSDMPWKHRLFDSLLVFQNYPMDADARQMGEGVRCEPLAVPQSTPFSLTLAVQADADPWSLHLMGRGPCVPPALLAPLLDELVRLLEQLAAAGGQETVGEWLQHLPPATRGWARRPPAAVQRPIAPPPAAPLNGAAQPTNGHAPAVTNGQAGAAIPGPAPIQAPGHAQGVAQVAPASSATGGTPPAQAVQAALVEVWCELLGVADVPLDTNFFEMGVQSLQLVRAHRMLQQRLARPLRLLDMVTHPTVRQLAQAWGVSAPAAPGHPLAAAAAARARRWRSAQRPADPKA